MSYELMQAYLETIRSGESSYISLSQPSSECPNDTDSQRYVDYIYRLASIASAREVVN